MSVKCPSTYIDTSSSLASPVGRRFISNVAEVDAARLKLEYDFYYIKHFSYWLDFVIIIRDFHTILTRFRLPLMIIDAVVLLGGVAMPSAICWWLNAAGNLPRQGPYDDPKGSR